MVKDEGTVMTGRNDGYDILWICPLCISSDCIAEVGVDLFTHFPVEIATVLWSSQTRLKGR
jgi:hypothetical protein